LIKDYLLIIAWRLAIKAICFDFFFAFLPFSFGCSYYLCCFSGDLPSGKFEITLA
jgi:hypothetical protein